MRTRVDRGKSRVPSGMASRKRPRPITLTDGPAKGERVYSPGYVSAEKEFRFAVHEPFNYTGVVQMYLYRQVSLDSAVFVRDLGRLQTDPVTPNSLCVPPPGASPSSPE